MIRKITFEQIYPIWQLHLWPTRQSKIERTSAMKFFGGYDIENMSFDPTFFGYFFNNQLVGVNSGHSCVDGSYRSRGLFVFPEFRKHGIGVQLLRAAITQAHAEYAYCIWSYPKKSSWTTYEKAGFTLASNWEQSELDINAYAIKIF
jgi:GNAT superfamily N-acetyltransferase